jgi:beta-phosphoglucomutase
MDGVIVNSMPAHARSWIRAFAGMGIAVDTLDIYRREGMSGPVSIREICAEKGHGLPDDEMIRGLHQVKLRYFAEEERPLFPEIPAILELLDRNRITYALVSGSHRSSVEGSIPADVLRRFSAVISADDVTHAKPHPEPYLTGLTRLGANPAISIVVENAPMGIRAAKAAGYSA